VADARPTVVVVGLGPAGPELLGPEARELLEGADAAFLRTSRHPAAAAFGGLATFDHHYEAADSFEEVYDRIVADLLGAARDGRRVVYAVPGSPLVSERTVELLRADPSVDVVVHPALSFLDLAWARLGVDPLAAGVRLVDGTRFAEQAAGERGPLLVAQCWSKGVLSEIKLAVTAPPPGPVTVLHHLGLPDEVVAAVGWEELDRAADPDHLTSLWVPVLEAPVAAELVALDELVRRLRRDCPWDREQTHASLRRHLLEESYEVLDAIEGLTHLGRPGGEAAVAHLEEELGDLLFQVYFHSLLAAEEGRFTLADVARGLHAKLVSRHPHVFGDVVAGDSGTVLVNWETLKREEKGRRSVTEGIPAALPALALAAKLQRKASAVPGVALPELGELRDAVLDEVRLLGAGTGGDGGHPSGTGRADERLPAPPGQVAGAGALLFKVSDLVRRLGVEPEEALRSAAGRFADQIRAAEAAVAGAAGTGQADAP
jgi:tetrapyrrole methylase family protein/MazG family protein